MGEVVPREGTCPSGRGDGSGFSPCGGRGAVKGMEPRFGFGWGGVGDLRRVSSCSRLERTRDVRVEMGAESAQVVVLGLGPGRPFPAPSLFADGPPAPGGEVSALCRAAPPPGARVEPWLEPSTRAAPLPPPSARTPLLAAGCRPGSNGKVPEIGARTAPSPSAGNSTLDRWPCRVGSRGGAVERQGSGSRDLPNLEAGWRQRPISPTPNSEAKARQGWGHAGLAAPC